MQYKLKFFNRLMKASLLLLVSLSFLNLETTFSSRNHIFLEYEDDINSLSELSLNTNYDSSGSTFYSYSSYLDFYFSNLQGNMGRNVRGTCGYVAIAMLLSYYDSLTNDNLIPENYDINNVEIASIPLVNRSESPGVLCEEVPQSCNANNDTEYNNFLYSMRDVSLHAKLIALNNYVYGTSYSSRTYVLNTFLTNISNFSSYTITGINYDYYFLSTTPLSTRQYYSDVVKQYIISSVQNGIPVLASATTTLNNSHHAFIIYGYDSDTDSLIANFGWGYGSSRVFINSSSFYSLLKSAMVLNITSSHQHSNNYIFRSPYSDVYNYFGCPCGYTNHTHTYDYYYQSLTAAKHKAFCTCGNYLTEVHTPDVYGQHCIFCGRKLSGVILNKEDVE